MENARLYTLPPEPPPLMIAAAGRKSAEVAGRLGDGLICTSPERELVQAFEAAGGRGKPCYAEVTVCWAEDERSARRTAHRQWPIAAMEGPLSSDLAAPAHFQAVAKMVTEDAIAEEIVCGPDPGRHLEASGKYADAGFDHVYVHQVGPEQEGFLRFYAREVLPRLASRRHAA